MHFRGVVLAMFAVIVGCRPASSASDAGVVDAGVFVDAGPVSFASRGESWARMFPGRTIETTSGISGPLATTAGMVLLTRGGESCAVVHVDDSGALGQSVTFAWTGDFALACTLANVNDDDDVLVTVRNQSGTAVTISFASTSAALAAGDLGAFVVDRNGGAFASLVLAAELNTERVVFDRTLGFVSLERPDQDLHVRRRTNDGVLVVDQVPTHNLFGSSTLALDRGVLRAAFSDLSVFDGQVLPGPAGSVVTGAGFSNSACFLVFDDDGAIVGGFAVAGIQLDRVTPVASGFVATARTSSDAAGVAIANLETGVVSHVSTASNDRLIVRVDEAQVRTAVIEPFFASGGGDDDTFIVTAGTIERLDDALVAVDALAVDDVSFDLLGLVEHDTSVTLLGDVDALSNLAPLGLVVPGRPGEIIPVLVHVDTRSFAPAALP